MSLAWNLWRADWKSGRLGLLSLALVMSVTVATGLTAFTQRLQIMLAGEATQFLAADRVLESSREVPDNWLLPARQFDLQMTRQLQFQSMLYAGDKPQLVSVKAVEQAYPMRGELAYRLQPGGPVIRDRSGPGQGEIWVEGRLLSLLDLQPGNQVDLGEATLTISAILVSEPDRGAGSFSLGPRVLMAWEDIPRTGVVSPASRLTWGYQFAGNAPDIGRYEAVLLPLLTDSQQWLDLEKSQPTVAQSLGRARQFFLLASSVAIVLACLAIAVTAHHYAGLQVKGVAVLKTLGMTSVAVRMLYLKLLLIQLCVAVPTGLALGWGLQECIIRYAASLLDVPPPSMGLSAFWVGLACAITSLFGFFLPPLLRLSQLPAVQIFQRDSFGMGLPVWQYAAWSLPALALLLFIYNGEALLTLVVIGVLVLVCLVVALPVAWVIRRLRIPGMQASGWWNLALSNLKRRLHVNAVFTAVFAISLLLSLVLQGVQGQMFSQWANQLPANTPNYFIANIRDNELQVLESWFTQQAVKSQRVYPMVRARLVALNDAPIRKTVSKEKFRRSGADRELNLSWSATLPEDNTLVEGKWFATDQLDGVSVELELANKLGIKMGDKLTFQMADHQLVTHVSSLRRVEWDRMRPNFYMLFPEPLLQSFPRTWMTSFYLPQPELEKAALLARAFPTAIVIDLDMMIMEIRKIIQQVSLALQMVLAFVLAGTLLLMLAGVQAGMPQRLQEATLVRALGGTRQLLGYSLFTEFALMGLVAGLVATVLAEVVLLVLQRQVFDMALQWHPQLWWQAPVAGALLVGIAGYVASRNILNTPPMQLLRAS